MSVHKLILDNRIHRTLRISTDQQEYNLVPASEYKVLLKVVDGHDTLVISKNGDQLASVACTHTYTPPASGTKITEIENASCQFSMDIDDAAYRIIELHQFICDPEEAKAWVTSSSNNANPPAITNNFSYEGKGVALDGPVDGKVPPQLG